MHTLFLKDNPYFKEYFFYTYYLKTSIYNTYGTVSLKSKMRTNNATFYCYQEYSRRSIELDHFYVEVVHLVVVLYN